MQASFAIDKPNSVGIFRHENLVWSGKLNWKLPLFSWNITICPLVACSEPGMWQSSEEGEMGSWLMQLPSSLLELSLRFFCMYEYIVFTSLNLLVWDGRHWLMSVVWWMIQRLLEVLYRMVSKDSTTVFICVVDLSLNRTPTIPVESW